MEVLHLQMEAMEDRLMAKEELSLDLVKLWHSNLEPMEECQHPKERMELME